MAVSVGMGVLRVTVPLFDTQVTAGGGVLSVYGGLGLCSVCERDFQGVCKLKVWVHEKVCVCLNVCGVRGSPLCGRTCPACCSL